MHQYELTDPVQHRVSEKNTGLQVKYYLSKIFISFNIMEFVCIYETEIFTLTFC